MYELKLEQMLWKLDARELLPLDEHRAAQPLVCAGGCGARISSAPTLSLTQRNSHLQLSVFLYSTVFVCLYITVALTTTTSRLDSTRLDERSDRWFGVSI